MAADSLVGGVTVPGGGQLVLSDSATGLLNAVFGDTIGGTFQSASVVGGTGGGVVVSGGGMFGESQQLFAPTLPTIGFTGDIASGTLTVNLTLPQALALCSRALITRRLLRPLPTLAIFWTNT